MPIERDHFRNAIGHFATGVTVVTTHHEGKNHGLTASAVASVSLDPPTLLICVNRQAASCAAIASARAFAVHILRQDQDGLATQFARPGEGKFDGVGVAPGVQNLPLLAGSLARIQCRVVQALDAATHTVFIGEVLQVEVFDGAPLVYYRGKMGRFAAAATP